MVQALFEKGAKVNEQAENGSVPLHLAAYNGHKAVVECLIKVGADIFARNKHDTVLHQAISGNNIELIQFILANINRVTDKDLQRRYQLDYRLKPVVW
jgi:ankyrin repeat protein